MRVALEDEGYFVLAAGDGEQALSMSRQFPGTIHALLSDVKMPNLDGLELRKTILTERPESRFYLCLDTPRVQSRTSQSFGNRLSWVC